MWVPSYPVDGPMTVEEINSLKEECLERLRVAKLYELRNDAKLRAVNSVQSYDEFKDIVDAAHMQPITRGDKMNAQTKSRLWNPVAHEENVEKGADQSIPKSSDANEQQMDKHLPLN